MPALDGIKVLDLARIGPGIITTFFLGDMGAEIIKVEPAAQVTGRQKGLRASLVDGPDKESKKENAFYALGRNKKSVAINLSIPEGQAIFHRLAQYADVVLEAYRPGVAKRLNIDYRTMARINPKLVYCAISSYGQNGPSKDDPGHDVNFLAIAGVLDLLGEKGRPPAMPLNIPAFYTGSLAVNGILAALIARGRTGKGQYVDVSLTDASLSLLTIMISKYYQSGTVPSRAGVMFNGAYPYLNVYETKDKRYITLGCIEPWFWENLCRALGLEQFIPFKMSIEHLYAPPEDPKWEEITASLRKTFRTRTADEWMELFKGKDIAATKVLNLEEALAHPQFEARRMIRELKHPECGQVKQMGHVIKFGSTPCKVKSFAPLLGEHTDEILRSAGYTSREILRMRKEGVVS